MIYLLPVVPVCGFVLFVSHVFFFLLFVFVLDFFVHIGFFVPARRFKVDISIRVRPVAEKLQKLSLNLVQ